MLVTKKKFEAAVDRLKDCEKNISTTIKRLDIRITELEDLTKRVDQVEALEERIKELEKYVADYTEFRKLKESEEPFIEVISQSFDSKEGIEIKLDWNDAMINYLKRSGYQGEDDEAIVSKYVSDLFNSKKGIADEPKPIA